MTPLEDLLTALKPEEPMFACGGSVDIETATDHSENELSHKSPLVIIRWTRGSTSDTLTFPLSQGTDGQQDIEMLLTRGSGEIVLHESYRQVIMLDAATDFLTNFNPAEVGIVDAIKQTLFSTLVQESSDKYSVFAKLGKLTVHSTPSRKSKSHDDASRGVKRFGSLVVCLPCAHEGMY